METFNTEDTTEWVNGLPPVGTKCEALFIEHEHKGYGEFLVLGYHGSYVWMEYIGELSNTSEHFTAKVSLIRFRKPETEAERIEREELEAAYDLYRDYCDGTNFKGVGFDLFKDPTDNREVWLGIVRKPRYTLG